MCFSKSPYVTDSPLKLIRQHIFFSFKATAGVQIPKFMGKHCRQNKEKSHEALFVGLSVPQITRPLKSRSCLQCVKITACCSLPSRVFTVAVTDDGASSLNGTFYNFLSFSFHLSHISICLKEMLPFIPHVSYFTPRRAISHWAPDTKSQYLMTSLSQCVKTRHWFDTYIEKPH